jgi:hypothetical protein
MGGNIAQEVIGDEIFCKKVIAGIKKGRLRQPNSMVILREKD